MARTADGTPHLVAGADGGRRGQAGGGRRRCRSATCAAAAGEHQSASNHHSRRTSVTPQCLSLLVYVRSSGVSVRVCKGGRRDGGCSRHVDGGRFAGRARGAAGAGCPAGTEGHHMDETLRRWSPLSHHGQEPKGTLCRIRRHRGGRRHHRQTDQQK